MKSLKNNFVFLLSIFLSPVSHGGITSGTPTITDTQNMILENVRIDALGLKTPVIQLEDADYIELIAAINLVATINGKEILVKPMEILISDGIPVLRLSHSDQSHPDIFVVTPKYYKSITNAKDFYDQVYAQAPSLPRIGP